MTRGRLAEAHLHHQPREGVSMKPTPDLYDRLRADAVRAAQTAPRRGNNPWTTPEQYPRPAYRDPTGETATARADKARKTPRR